MVLILKYSPKIFIDTLGMGHAVAQLVEALHYKREGRGFDS
jgi:DNA polymerase III gamma/tau subunit